MGIHKASAGALHKSGEIYVVVPADTIELLQSADALAILLYLLNKPQDWQVQPTDIKRRLGIGRPRQEAAFRELNHVGLMTMNRRKGPDGKFRRGVDYELYAHPSMNPELGDNHSYRNLRYGPAIAQENHSAGKPSDGKPAPLHIDRVITHEQSYIHGRGKGVQGRRSTREMTLEENLNDKTWADSEGEVSHGTI